MKVTTTSKTVLISDTSSDENNTPRITTNNRKENSKSKTNYNIVSPENNYNENKKQTQKHHKVSFSFNDVNGPSDRHSRRRLKRNKKHYNKKIDFDSNKSCYEGDLEENNNYYADSNNNYYYSPSKNKRKKRNSLQSSSPRSKLMDNFSLPIAVSPDDSGNNSNYFLPMSMSSNSMHEQQHHSPSLSAAPSTLRKEQQNHQRKIHQNYQQKKRTFLCPLSFKSFMTLIIIISITMCNYTAFFNFHIFTFNYSKYFNDSNNSNTKQSYRTKRIIHYDNPANNNQLLIRKNRKIDIYPTEFSDNTQLYSMLDSHDPAISSTIETNKKPAIENKNNCVPMKEWQKTFYPTCTIIHEISFNGNNEDIKLIGKKGFWRNAWVYDTSKSAQSSSNKNNKEDEETKVVIKTLRYLHNYEQSFYEHNRIDAIAMERLTSSNHIVNIYGFCGNSVITEYANGPRLGTIADKTRSSMKKQKKNGEADLALLQYAIDIAQGIADIHEIDYPYNHTTSISNATFIHLDINPANIITTIYNSKNNKQPQLKINDFNIGILNSYNPIDKKICGFNNHEYPNPQWRSPEEQLLFLNKIDKKKYHKTNKNLNEKVDVFSMGHIFYRLICGHEPWNKLEPRGMPNKKELSIKVSKGILPTIPKDVKESKNIVIKRIYKAMMKCYTYDPNRRPSARVIANDLFHGLESLTGKNKKK